MVHLKTEDPVYTYQDLADKPGIERKSVFGRIKKLKKGILEKEARQINKLKVIEAAAKLGISHRP